MKNIGIIILAAGSSSRMGQSKQLLPVYGKPMLRHITELAVSLHPAVAVVVLGDHEHAHRDAIKSLPVNIVINTNWASGMGSSLKSGIGQLLKLNPSVDACLVLVCDQPHVSAHYLTMLMEQYETAGKSIAASFYANSPGVPAIFNRTLFEELMSLDDAHGAKKIIERNLHDTVSVPFPEGAVDLDTEDDYRKFLKEQ
jgi:molybdenum cofactor cytidylyltransferase